MIYLIIHQYCFVSIKHVAFHLKHRKYSVLSIDCEKESSDIDTGDSRVHIALILWDAVLSQRRRIISVKDEMIKTRLNHCESLPKQTRYRNHILHHDLCSPHRSLLGLHTPHSLHHSLHRRKCLRCWHGHLDHRHICCYICPHGLLEGHLSIYCCC